MDLIRVAIDRPIAVVAAVLMVVLFGLVALQTIPIQLAPDVNKPVITITTNRGGAAPAEVEREITNRQEEALKGKVRSVEKRIKKHVWKIVVNDQGRLECLVIRHFQACA